MNTTEENQGPGGTGLDDDNASGTSSQSASANERQPTFSDSDDRELREILRDMETIKPSDTLTSVFKGVKGWQRCLPVLGSRAGKEFDELRAKIEKLEKEKMVAEEKLAEVEEEAKAMKDALAAKEHEVDVLKKASDKANHEKEMEETKKALANKEEELAGSNKMCEELKKARDDALESANAVVKRLGEAEKDMVPQSKYDDKVVQIAKNNKALKEKETELAAEKAKLLKLEESVRAIIPITQNQALPIQSEPRAAAAPTKLPAPPGSQTNPIDVSKTRDDAKQVKKNFAENDDGFQVQKSRNGKPKSLSLYAVARAGGVVEVMDKDGKVIHRFVLKGLFGNDVAHGWRQPRQNKEVVLQLERITTDPKGKMFYYRFSSGDDTCGLKSRKDLFRGIPQKRAERVSDRKPAAPAHQTVQQVQHQTSGPAMMMPPLISIPSYAQRAGSSYVPQPKTLEEGQVANIIQRTMMALMPALTETVRGLLHM